MSVILRLIMFSIAIILVKDFSNMLNSKLMVINSTNIIIILMFLTDNSGLRKTFLADIKELLDKLVILMLSLFQLLTILDIKKLFRTVFKSQNRSNLNGNCGKDFYSGSTETYVLPYHHVLSHMVNVILKLNSHKRKKLLNQPLLYGMFTKN